MGIQGVSSQQPYGDYSSRVGKYDNIEGIRNNSNITPAFLQEVEAMAERLGTHPEYLLAAMSFESNLRPDAVNATSGATGLIQFMDSTAAGLGTSTEALRGMSAMDQLKYVEKYLEPFKGQLNSMEAVYTSILSGSPKADPDTVLFDSGAAYSQNAALDLNHDGRITAGEATGKVREKVDGDLPPPLDPNLRYFS